MSLEIPAVEQAIFPVAGFGTRFLPATKTVPKELLPVLDRPLIDYAVAEAHQAGIKHIVMVTGRNKSALEDYFDYQPELETKLLQSGKLDMIEKINRPLDHAASISFVRQREAKGLGHAIWCARDFIDQTKPFAVISPDDLVLHDQGCLRQMQDEFKRLGGNLMAVMDVPLEHTNRYGVLSTPNSDSKTPLVTGLVEKPDPKDAPSTLSIIGRYILQPEIFKVLDHLPAGAHNEIQLTDAITALIGKSPVHGYRFAGTRFDCGSVDGWLAANNAYYAHQCAKP
ncbi:MAG: UTP--glucose-1-phosphate uridylyltransferase [Alphaproteobacteria bacterium]